ncbi:unnamed protein product, partial [Protopolystoma xenopodis]
NEVTPGWNDPPNIVQSTKEADRKRPSRPRAFHSLDGNPKFVIKSGDSPQIPSAPLVNLLTLPSQTALQDSQSNTSLAAFIPFTPIPYVPHTMNQSFLSNPGLLSTEPPSSGGTSSKVIWNNGL